MCKYDGNCTNKYWSTVKPTCTIACCAKNKKIKWKHQNKRKIDRKYEQENWMRRKLTVIKKKEEVKLKEGNN